MVVQIDVISNTLARPILFCSMISRQLKILIFSTLLHLNYNLILYIYIYKTFFFKFKVKYKIFFIYITFNMTYI